MQLYPPPEKESALEKKLQREASPPEGIASPHARSPKPKRKWFSKRWAIALFAAGLLGIGTTAYLTHRNAQPKTDAIAELTVPVESQNLRIRIQASGNVRPIQSVNLSPKAAGTIAKLLVEQGDSVEAGQVVAEMESAGVRAQLLQAEANLAQAEARLDKLQAGNRSEEITQAQARLNSARARLDKLRAGSRPEEITQAQARLNSAQARLNKLRAGSRPEEIDRARSQVESAQAKVDLSQENVRRSQMLVDEGAIAQSDLDRDISEDRSARATLEDAQKNLEQLQKGTRLEEIDQAEAEVAEAVSQLEQVKNGTRPEEIAATEGEVAEAESKLEEVKNGTRPEEIAAAEAEVAEAKGRVRYQEVQLDDTVVRAPFAGKITQRFATEGAFVTPTTQASNADSGTSTSIVALARGLEILAKVPEADISQIKPGQNVEIVADAYPDEVFKGRVNLIAPEAIKERDVTLFQVRVDLDSGLDKLQSGMNVDLTFLGNQLSDALVVPTVAIVTQKGQTGVLIPDENNKATFRAVTIGPTIGNQIQILEGVQSGERVFVGLPEGQKLEDIIKDKKLQE